MSLLAEFRESVRAVALTDKSECHFVMFVLVLVFVLVCLLCVCRRAFVGAV